MLQHRQAEVAQPIQLVLVGEALKVTQRGDGRREGLQRHRGWAPAWEVGGLGRSVKQMAGMGESEHAC